MYYTVIKHYSHLRTLEKCRKHSPAARAFHISLVFSNACRVLSPCNTGLRLLYLLMKTLKVSESCANGIEWPALILVRSAISMPRDVPQYVHDSVSNVSHLPAVNYRIQRRVKKYESE